MCILLVQVLFPYHAESEVELNLSVGDYIVIRKVCDDLQTLSLYIFFAANCVFCFILFEELPLSLFSIFSLLLHV